MKVYLPSAIP